MTHRHRLFRVFPISCQYQVPDIQLILQISNAVLKDTILDEYISSIMLILFDFLPYFIDIHAVSAA